MKIPFNDLKLQDLSMNRESRKALFSALNVFELINGKEVSEFQCQFAKVLGAQHCITTSSGTDALFISLKTLGVKTGDEVITPALSWISSSETISLCGATPVFVDVDPQYYTIDPCLIEEKITPRTKAMIAVHLYGQAAHISEGFALSGRI